MLVDWKISNFKSFREETLLTFAGINVIAGANSSGKSTIIQSILLLKQTLQYGAPTRPVALNGPLLRLGAFDDLRNFYNSGGSVDIGFTIRVASSEFSKLTSKISTQTLNDDVDDESDRDRIIKLDLAFGATSSFSSSNEVFPQFEILTPRMLSGNLSIHLDKNGEQTTSIESNYSDSYHNYLKFKTEIIENMEGFNLYPVSMDLDVESNLELFKGRPGARTFGGYASHFLPRFVNVEYNQRLHVATRAVAYIMEGGFSLVSLPDRNQTLPIEVAEFVNEWLVSINKEASVSTDTRPTVQVIRIAVQTALYGPPAIGLGIGRARRRLQSDETVAKLEVGLLQIIASDANRPETATEFGFPKNISAATDFISNYFKRSVRYLGPLRDSPRPVYQPEALEATTDVGYRGEHTAAVLDLNGGNQMLYVLPPTSDDQPYFDEYASELVSLKAAVRVWLQYLGVAEDVMTSDAGVYGNRLQVKTDAGDSPHDLTNVGVGVSQVLPIVVMSLLSPRDSLLIFEQPELHLHPKVQARLADFFISLSLNGRQTLLETHSEYLIDRLRLRIALSQRDDTNQQVNIQFSERKGPASRLVPIKVNKYGAIKNWPKDFFDQSQRDVGRILKAATLKQKQSRV